MKRKVKVSKCSLNKNWKKGKFNVNNIKRRKTGEFDSKVFRNDKLIRKAAEMKLCIWSILILQKFKIFHSLESRTIIW